MRHYLPDHPFGKMQWKARKLLTTQVGMAF